MENGIELGGRFSPGNASHKIVFPTRKVVVLDTVREPARVPAQVQVVSSWPTS